VEILTQNSAEPSRDWLKTVTTPGARSKIRKWLKVKGYQESVSLGRDILERQFRKAGKPLPSEREIDDLAQSFGRSDSEHLFFSVGCGEVSGERVLNKTYPQEIKAPPIRKAPLKPGGPAGVKVQGIGNLMIRFAKCCQPVPGDKVVGLVTRGHGISIHRATCGNLLGSGVEGDRLVEVDWDTDREQGFPVDLLLFCEDRRNLLADVAKAISDENVDIINADVGTRDGVPRGLFTVQVKNLKQLDKVMRAMARVKGVDRVVRRGDTSGE
jgi:guanosine-3',5'-bis(diphosphate) 3'-pyrophosphohydrolase